MAKRRACMLAYTFYETDGRVMRYAEALAQSGTEVEAIVLRRAGQPREEVVNGVRVLRIQERKKNEKTRYTYLWRITQFLLRSMVTVTRRHLKRRFDLIHVHSVPDFEIFAAALPKALGAKLILDIHDIVPEFYAAKFKVSNRSWVFRALLLVERLSTAFADHVIISNDLWRDKITRRSVPENKCSAIINYPDVTIFHPGLRARRSDGKFVVVYPGTLNWHQGVDLAVRAIARVAGQIPGVEFHIYGEGPAKPELQALVLELNLSHVVSIREPLPIRAIAQTMADADLGVVPKRDEGFGGEAFSTKILEFMALGVPLVVAETRIDRYYFNETQLKFFRAGDDADLARAILEIYRDSSASMGRAVRALVSANAASWAERKGEYLRLVNRLVAGGI